MGQQKPDLQQLIEAQLHNGSLAMLPYDFFNVPKAH